MLLRHKYPSVTEVISEFLETRFYTDSARDAGTEAHEVCNQILHDRPYDKENEYADGFSKWTNIVNPKVLFSEKTLYDNELKFCGTPDFVGYVDGIDGLGVIDFKTSKGRQKHWTMQICAYAYLCMGEGAIVKWGASQRLRKQGLLPFWDFCFMDPIDIKIPNPFNKFLTLLRLVS